MQVTDPLSLHLPQLDSMLEAIESEQFDELFEQFADLDQTFGLLYGTYVEELHYLAADEPQNEVAERIGEKFADIRPLISALRDDLSLGDYSAAQETLVVLKDQAITLFSLFGEYREAAQAGPRYSEIPYTHELLRVCHHYLNGALSIDAVQGRLEVFCQYHEALENQVATIIPSPPERETFEQRAEDLEEVLNIQLQGIEDLDYALERNDERAIADSLETLSEAAEVLVDIYKSLQKADLQPRTVACIRCGADNSIEARVCGECSAVLPQRAALEAPTSTIALEEDGTAVGPQEAEEITRLQNAVNESLQTGQKQGLLDALEDYGKRLARNKRQFDRMDNPPGELPSAQLALLERAREIFSAALAQIEEGYALLTEGAPSLSPHLLETGIERMREGTQRFQEFQAEFQKAQSMTPGR
jgi:hypothetical protein